MKARCDMYSIVIEVNGEPPDDEHVSRIIAILEPQMNHSLFGGQNTTIWINGDKVEPARDPPDW